MRAREKFVKILMEEPFLGALNDSKSFLCLPQRASTSQLPMPPRKLFGYDNLFCSFSASLWMQQLFFLITSQQSHSLKNTNTMLERNTSMYASISSVGSLKRGRFDSFTAPPKKWWPISSQKLCRLRKSNILLENLVSYCLEEECWNLNSEELSWRRKTRNRREYKTTETQLSLSVDGFYALRIFFIGIWALRLVLSYGHIAVFLIALLSWTVVLIVHRLYSMIILSCAHYFQPVDFASLTSPHLQENRPVSLINEMQLFVITPLSP